MCISVTDRLAWVCHCNDNWPSSWPHSTNMYSHARSWKFVLVGTIFISINTKISELCQTHFPNDSSYDFISVVWFATAAWTIIIGLSELGHYHYISKIGCELTHWGRVTQICVSKQTIIGSDDGLSPGRRQAIIWTNAGILLIGTLGTNFSEIFIEIRMFSFKKMGLKVSSAKQWPFCLGFNVLSHGWSCMLLQYRWWLKWIKTTSVRCGSTKYWIKLKSYFRGENKWNHKMGWLTSLKNMWRRAKTTL